MGVTVVTAPQVYQIAKDDAGFAGVAPSRTVVVSFDGMLGEGETQVDSAGAGTDDPEVIGASLVTVTNGPTIITDAVTRINGKRVTASKALTFTIQATTSTGTDVLTVYAEASTGERLVGYITIEVV